MIEKISAEFAAIVSEFEGFRARPYKCPAGVWTIGYGHTGKDTTAAGLRTADGQTLKAITEAQGMALLLEDMTTAEREVVAIQNKGVTLKQREFDALASFVYNVGAGNFRSSTLYKILLTGKATAAEVRLQLMRWTKAGGKVLPGLVKRRTAEADWYEGKK